MAIKLGRPLERSRVAPGPGFGSPPLLKDRAEPAAERLDLAIRPRRNRRAEWARRMVREHTLTTDDLIWPLFIVDGAKKRVPVDSMPGVERLSVENDLGRALEREQLQLLYQPIVSLRDGTIVALEALLRWKHHERGMIAPAEFIPVAEESGMIEPIGRWVLATACRQAAEWHAEAPEDPMPGVSVNLSGRQFLGRELEPTVEHALAAAALDPSYLRLEITESVLLDDPHWVSERIRRVSRLGVRFVLDDFGTGYSSLAYLSELSIDGLKVDRSFVAALGADPRSTAITTAIVRMAQALAIEVTAEGVETAGQLKALRGLGCELAQGFLLHRPLSTDAVSALLRGRGAARPLRSVSAL